MIVKELMSTNVCFVTADARISDAAALMKQYDIGFVPVCDKKGSLLGVLTDRDLVLRALLPDGAAPSEPLAGDIMSKETITVTSEMNIHDAACIFAKEKVRRLPVLENDRLAGVLSLSDLAKKKVFLAEIGDIMGSLSKKQELTH